MTRLYILINSYPLFYVLQKLCTGQKTSGSEVIGLAGGAAAIIYLIYYDGKIGNSLLLLAIGALMVALFKQSENLET